MIEVGGHEQPAPSAGFVAGSNSRQLVAIIDRDSEFVRLLTARLDVASICHRTLPLPASVHALVRMRLNALVIDLASLGEDGPDYLQRTCVSLPALAVVVCTGPSSLAQRIRGLRTGADAWITKPCHPEEVVCMIAAALRRNRRHELPDLAAAITVGEITIRPDLYQAYVNGESAQLTRREFEILHLLAQSVRVLRREEAYERVWGYTMAAGDRSVDVYVRKLRQKLQAVSPRWSYIQTHFGVGYRLAPEREHSPTEAVAADRGAAKRQVPSGRRRSTHVPTELLCGRQNERSENERVTGPSGHQR